jgi:ElaA protein
MDKLSWKLYAYHQLNVDLLYEILRLPTEVFVVEQECPYQEVDGKDQASWHLLAYENGTLIAYARLLPPYIMGKPPSEG